MTDSVNAAATLLFTYGAHSAVTCVLALTVGRFLRRPQERDVLWKATILLPFITTCVTLVRSNHLRVDLARLARVGAVVKLPARRVMIQVLEENGVRDVQRTMSDPVATVISASVILLALTAAFIAASRLIRRRRALARALDGRCAVDRVHGISVSVADALPSPVALHGSEICLPRTVMLEFSERHRQTLFAHEVAHVRRRDPAWFSIFELVTALSAFQPLVFLVARAFRRDVELICDELAIRETHDRQGLIGALALLAAPFDAQSAVLCAPTAYDGSPLVARATRIATLDDSFAGDRRVAFVVITGLAAALTLLPVVATAPRLEDFPLELRGARNIIIRRPDADHGLVQMQSRIIRQVR